MRRATIFMIMLGGCCLAAGEAKALSASYDQTITQSGKVIAGKVTVKGELFRMEMRIGEEPTITVKNQSGVYSYLPSEEMAMRLPALDVSQQPVASEDDYQAYLQAQHAEHLRSETVNGYPCEVYRFLDPHTHGPATVWVWTEKQFPVKFELSGLSEGTVVELTNIRLGIAADDALFQLPPDVKVMDMGSMLNMGRQGGQ